MLKITSPSDGSTLNVLGHFKESFQIGTRWIGGDAPVLIIAEAGVSHFGSLEKAIRLVDLAADAGADLFKTQAFATDRLISSRSPEWRDRLRSKEADFDFLAAMKARCDERDLPFICTGHDESVLPWLDELNVPAFKIGSGERGNVEFIRTIAERGKPVILSTGMYRREDVQDALEAVQAAGCDELAVLHCVTSYPTPPEQVNLRAMDVLREMFPGPVGYSDHTQGPLAVMAAVARRAQIIEKHISLDFDIPNAQDWKVSCGPDDFHDFVSGIRAVEGMLGKAEKCPQACETEALEWALKSLVATRELPAGTIIEAGMLTAKRPGGGLPPSRHRDVIGRRLKRRLVEDEALAEDDIEIK
jgi:N-acetylneuraminate synthase/N,N'-diacetyllegionaminate synthase